MTQWDKLNNVVLRKFSVTWHLQIQLTPMCKLADVLAMCTSKSPADMIIELIVSKSYMIKTKNNNWIMMM